jgi:hypothetical protein
MQNKIRETLEKDIAEMLEFVAQNPHWENYESFEYEFMVNKDGELMYEQWQHSPDEAPVDMDNSPLFTGLKNLNYTGVCYIRFHNHGALITGEQTESEGYLLEVVLTNSAFHTPAPYYLSDEDGEVNIVFMTDDHPEDDRYYFPLTKEWEIKA